MNLEEAKLRKLIRKGIHVVQERKKQQFLDEQRQQFLDEKRLRGIIRYLIHEVKRKTAVANKVIHKNTGINVLDNLLKKVISQLEDAYTNLSSDDKQRKSFRYHILVNFKNALAPVDANRIAPDEQYMALAEQGFKVTSEQDDIISPPDESKFLPARPEDIEQAKADVEEEEKEFVKLDSADPSVQQGAEEAENTWNDIQTQIIGAYERLIVPKDAATFKDWGLTNLKLYFDKFEGEMTSNMVPEPKSPDYPPKEGAGPLEEVYEI